MVIRKPILVLHVRPQTLHKIGRALGIETAELLRLPHSPE